MIKIEGKLFKVGSTVQISEKFSKRVFILETTEDMYPQKLEIILAQEKCSLLDGLKEGDTVSVSVNLRGREWTSPQGEVKFFNTIEAWSINKTTGGGTQAKPTTPNTVQAKPLDVAVEEDGLPF